ncbi:MAG TPA: sulfurtransferase TusA family protein [Rhodospirillales bacterium]|jgi:tRNA 2-thiouridine synthesizing protein A|nr:sulfurtransferase TusA family protein [Rhodospirillales bacterium]
MPIELDTKGLSCPLPILKVKKAMTRLEDNDILLVESTDPGSVKDFEVFCQTQGHQLLKSTQKNDLFIFHIRKIS